MVLADPEHVQPGVVGRLDFLQQVGHPVGPVSVRPVAVSGNSAAKLSMPISIIARA